LQVLRRILDTLVGEIVRSEIFFSYNIILHILFCYIRISAKVKENPIFKRAFRKVYATTVLTVESKKLTSVDMDTVFGHQYSN